MLPLKYRYRPLPDFLTIKKSPIEGLGLFTEDIIEIGTILGITHVIDRRFENNLIRTPLGGFINHSSTPNCDAIELDDMFQLITTKSIGVGEELTLDYNKTIK